MKNQTEEGAKDSPTDTTETLWQRKPLRTWAGRGTGAACNFCGHSIQTQEVEYEIELPPAGEGRSLRFHFNCYRAWEAAEARQTVQSELVR
jgi:hypothetical protein